MDPQVINVADAIRTIETALPLLDDAYWAAPDIADKDRFHDLVTVLQMELIELAKLSIGDHDLPYEPITRSFQYSLSKIKNIQQAMPQLINRTAIAIAIENELPHLIRLYPVPAANRDIPR